MKLNKVELFTESFNIGCLDRALGAFCHTEILYKRYIILSLYDMDIKCDFRARLLFGTDWIISVRFHHSYCVCFMEIGEPAYIIN